MFRVIDPKIRPLWVPVDYASTLYVGQMVCMGFNSGAQGAYPYTVAGAGDITNDLGIFGVVIGTNNRTPKFSGEADHAGQGSLVPRGDAAGDQGARAHPAPG